MPEQRSPDSTTAQDGATATNNIVASVVLGDDVFSTWYPSKYPDELVNKDTVKDGRLFVCKHCFRYTGIVEEYLAHSHHCGCKDAAPGSIVFESPTYQIYEVDGEEDKLFCQSLSLFAKLFLDTKSLSFDVESFKFYLLVERATPAMGKQKGSESRIVGFFSKEKMSWDDYNLACILVFPPFQRKGLGKLMIAFSYELSRLEQKVGSPEKPLSELGRLGYTSFWTVAVARKILQARSGTSMTVQEISNQTWIHQEDVITALKELISLTSSTNNKISKQRIRDWVNDNSIDLAPLIKDEHLVG